MNEKQLIEYYNKFNEDKRLDRKHGKVEFLTTLKYIYDYLSTMKNPKIIDIGAGTGKYSIALSKDGYDVTAVELVKHNLSYIKKYPNIKSYQGNAINLSRFQDETFDLTLLFGPMYHLLSLEEQILALKEAKRVTKKNGIIMVAYIMNDYCVLTHGFKDNQIKDCLKKNMIDENFKCIKWDHDLYQVYRIEEIDQLNKEVNLNRIKIITPDGPANYMRETLNKMDEETFEIFLNYHFKTCERMDRSCCPYSRYLKKIKSQESDFFSYFYHKSLDQIMVSYQFHHCLNGFLTDKYHNLVIGSLLS